MILNSFRKGLNLLFMFRAGKARTWQCHVNLCWLKVSNMCESSLLGMDFHMIWWDMIFLDMSDCQSIYSMFLEWVAQPQPGQPLYNRLHHRTMQPSVGVAFRHMPLRVLCRRKWGRECCRTGWTLIKIIKDVPSECWLLYIVCPCVVGSCLFAFFWEKCI